RRVCDLGDDPAEANVAGLPAMWEDVARAQTTEDGRYRPLPRLPAGSFEHGAIDRGYAEAVAAAMDRTGRAFVLDHAAHRADKLGCGESRAQSPRIAGPLGCWFDRADHRSCLRTGLAAAPQTSSVSRRRL